MTTRITINDVRAILAGGLVERLGATHQCGDALGNPIDYPNNPDGDEAATTIQSLAQAFIEMDAELVAMREVMRRVEPHLDAIVCYASTMGEHEPNRIAHDFRAIIKGTDHAS